MRDESLRTIAAPFVAVGPSGVAIRTRLGHLSADDEQVLRLVGTHLGSLASKDLKRRCADGLEHSTDTWAGRKRALTKESSSRWAGSITKVTHDQWALSRRAQLAYIHSLQAGVRTIAHRLSLPIWEKGKGRAPGGYRSAQEWFAKARRLQVLQDRLSAEQADRAVDRVRVVRGGKRLARNRHNLQAAQLTKAQWRQRWEASRWFLQADGESGKRFGNETIRVTPDGEVSLKLPAPLAHLANAPHGRYTLTGAAIFHHRREEWADRVLANRSVAYRIHYYVGRSRWYLTASWTIPPVKTVPLDVARAGGLIGVDTNADHLAAWRLDQHGNPCGQPRRFCFDLSGSAPHRDAQVRHALTRLLHWAARCGLSIAVEDLDFQAEKTREKHGRRKRFRKLISGMPVAQLRARLVSMGRRTRHQRRRRRSRLHQPLGRPALAETPHWQEQEDHPSRCGRHRDRTTRPRTPHPATDGTAPRRPERSSWASDRPGRTRRPGA
jgi:hypothetical protein